jgi:hypothetical protein
VVAVLMRSKKIGDIPELIKLFIILIGYCDAMINLHCKIIIALFHD